MPKRRFSDVEDVSPGRTVKRRYHNHVRLDRLSDLSDELLLRIFSHLPLSTLTRCERLNRRLSLVARDSQIWKAIYYNRWVKPRASQIPGRRNYRSEVFSSQPLKWLEHEALLKRGADLDWKRQYKIRHNWTKGICDVSEIYLTDKSVVNTAPCVRLHNSIAIAADAAGLRAWDLRNGQRLIAHLSMEADEDQGRTPRSLSVDDNAEGELRVAVGFQDGHFEIYELNSTGRSFRLLFKQEARSTGAVLAIAYSSPLLVTLTESQILSMFRFPVNQAGSVSYEDTKLTSLGVFKSQSAWPPLSLAIRKSSRSVLVSIAYALPTYLSGWTPGLQEMWLDPSGNILNSRLASAVSSAFRPLKSLTEASAVDDAESMAMTSLSRPTSISYSHPYLLCSHADNTLTLHLVTSTATSLRIGPGNSLFGHTSSVACAHVGGRGKAVSVSRFGDELRLWELEGGLSSSSARRRMAAGDLSIQIRAGSRGEGRSIDTAPNLTGGWVDFDDEQVVVLKEQDQGSSALMVYDFS